MRDDRCRVAVLPGSRTVNAPQLGSLHWQPAAERPDLLAGPVLAALPQLDAPAWVTAIDEDLADTAAFTEAYQVPLEVSANCVVVAARRAGRTTMAACVVLATTRADVNGLVRRHLDARKASFAPQEQAVAETGMDFGGITPVGLPDSWPLLIDAAVARADVVVVGSGTRGGKLALSGSALTRLPGATVLEGLGRPVDPAGDEPHRTSATTAGRAPDDSDVGWGEQPAAARDDDRRFLDNRPPHWGRD
jgi:prolyl-tRNA editing enzyme YbaK/EbsC (Cys-tRNA(Pro) deacylase)